MFLIDSHCHLELLNYSKINKIFSKSNSNYVKFILSVSTNLSDFISMKKKFKNFKNVFFSCGIHPLNLDERYDFNNLLNFVSDKKVLAIGETGLDYFYQKNNSTFQKKVFKDHISLSYKLNKPLIIHTRESEKDTFDILKKEKNNNLKGVVHSFSYNKKVLKLFLDLGLYISFSGMVTFHNADKIRQSAILTPLDRILIETDSPYLTPEPYRGKKNQPSNLLIIANFLANLKKMSINRFSEITNQNFCNLFKVKL